MLARAQWKVLSPLARRVSHDGLLAATLRSEPRRPAGALELLTSLRFGSNVLEDDKDPTANQEGVALAHRALTGRGRQIVVALDGRNHLERLDTREVLRGDEEEASVGEIRVACARKSEHALGRVGQEEVRVRGHVPSEDHEPPGAAPGVQPSTGTGPDRERRVDRLRKDLCVQRNGALYFGLVGTGVVGSGVIGHGKGGRRIVTIFSQRNEPSDFQGQLPQHRRGLTSWLRASTHQAGASMAAPPPGQFPSRRAAMNARLGSMRTARSWLVLSLTVCVSLPTAGCDRHGGTPGASTASLRRSTDGPHQIKTVFVILMENSNWEDQNDGQQFIHGNPSGPYINGLLPRASYCTNYYDNPAGVHPSEPNYIWLEAGSTLGIAGDADPSPSRVLTTADHLTAYMTKAGISWKAYAEDIDGLACPLATRGQYAPKHVPFVFFSDVVGNPPDTHSRSCIEHVRPYGELAGDLESNRVAAYNFITPNQCSDMHTPCVGDPVAQGDSWLARELPTVLRSRAYLDGGAVFITWDESVGGEHPIGMIVLSPWAKGGGYANNRKYYHSSLVATVEEIFGLSPLLGDAANRADLSDLFASFP